MSWQDARKLLCIRLDTMGDVLMSGPAMDALRHSLPGASLTLLTSLSGAAIARMMPQVDGVIVYEAPWMKATAPRASGAPDLEMAAALRRRRFDAAVIFTVYSQNPLPAAFLCHLAGIPLRLAHCRENPYQLLTSWVRETEPEGGVRHEVRRQLDLVKSVGCETPDERMRLCVPAAVRERVRLRLGRMGIGPGSRWVMVHPGATAASRRYPPEGFAEVARALVERGCRVVFTGVWQERELVESIRAAAGAGTVSLAGVLNLEELTALVSLAPLLVSNNTGPVHIAAALGTPVVDIYALTNPQHTPWMTPQRVLTHDVPCKYCYQSMCPAGHHECLRGIPPAAVVQAAEDLMAETAPARSGI